MYDTFLKNDMWYSESLFIITLQTLQLCLSYAQTRGTVNIFSLKINTELIAKASNVFLLSVNTSVSARPWWRLMWVHLQTPWNCLFAVQSYLFQFIITQSLNCCAQLNSTYSWRTTPWVKSMWTRFYSR